MIVSHRIAILSFLILCTISSAVAQSGIPRTISFQGVLLDASGGFISDGNHQLKLSVYDQAIGGSLLFTETQTVPVVRGVFNVIIGSTGQDGLPSSLTFDRGYWLGVSVNATAEMSPRTAMTAVPYAFYAERARAADSAGRAQSAHTVVGGVVSSLNGTQGDVTITAGAGTTVTRSGSTLTIAARDTTRIQIVRNSDNALGIANEAGPITTININYGGIRTEHLADAAVTTQKLADQAVTNAKLEANSVTTDKIQDLTILNGDLANNAVGLSKINMNGATARQAIISNGTDTPVFGSPLPGGPAGGDLADSFPNPTISVNAGARIVSAINNNGGIISDSRLSANIARLDTPNVFTGSSNTFNNGLSANGSRVSGVGSPTAAADAANKGYVDTAFGKAWVRGGNMATGSDRLGTTNANDLSIIAGDTTRITVSHNSGNVGMGTMAPAQRLEVKNGNLLLSNSGTAGELRLAEPSGAGMNYTALRARAQSGDITYTLPSALPSSNGRILSSTTSGTMDWSIDGLSLPYSDTVAYSPEYSSYDFGQRRNIYSALFDVTNSVADSIVTIYRLGASAGRFAVTNPGNSAPALVVSGTQTALSIDKGGIVLSTARIQSGGTVPLNAAVVIVNETSPAPDYYQAEAWVPFDGIQGQVIILVTEDNEGLRVFGSSNDNYHSTYDDDFRAIQSMRLIYIDYRWIPDY